MNSAVITKIEYRLIDDQNFSVLGVILYSGRLSESVSRNRSGNLKKTIVNFNVAKVSVENDDILNPIINRKAQFRCTDANGSIHLVGTDAIPARLTYQKSLEGNPGTFNGYRCSISCSSPKGSVVS